MKRRSAGIAEFALFLVTAASGIYGLGLALRGNGAWILVSGVALVVLSKQMTRVQDRWPKRRPARVRRGVRTREPGGEKVDAATRSIP